MATKQETVDFIIEQLSSLDIGSRKMFGEYALYCNGKTTGFICDNDLFIKIIPANQTLADGLSKAPAYPGSKDYYLVPCDRLEDRPWLQELIQTTAAALPAKKKK